MPSTTASDGLSVVTHRSFNVDRPMKTSISEMIQKRTITRGSGQPFSSKVMVDRRHAEDAPPQVSLKGGDLEDHRHRLQHEDAAHDEEHDLLTDHDGDETERGTERERTDVAHEDLGRIGVEPEKAETGADHGTAEYRHFGPAT